MRERGRALGERSERGRGGERGLDRGSEDRLEARDGETDRLRGRGMEEIEAVGGGECAGGAGAGDLRCVGRFA